jgi:hypothetical protein
MGLFDDADRLSNRSFPWALGRFRPEVDTDPGAREEPPPDLESMAVYVGEDGSVNVDSPMVLYKTKDPIQGGVELEFSKDNLFVEALRKVVGAVPTYGTLLFPTVLPGSVEIIDEEGFFGQPVVGPGTRTRYPKDTPDGYVPCAGQVLFYKGGRTVRVPNLASRTVQGGAGDGAATSTQYFAPPGMAYMMRVEEGWERSVPDLGGRELVDFGTPETPTLPGL